MPSTEKLDTHHKALTLNLDTSTFGSFAEMRRTGSRAVVSSSGRGLRHGGQNHFRLRQGSQR